MVLDEAQAIKNAATASAKAVRLLRGAHRLALSGTPVENHLGELWSLFEFLNPGMLGEAKRAEAGGRTGAESERRVAPSVGAGAAAVHPAAHQAAGRARAAGQDRADHLLRAGSDASGSNTTSCGSIIANRCSGASRSRAWANPRCTCWKRCCGCGRPPAIPACWTRSGRAIRAPSWILLMEQLDEVREEGHKALVFSQFTSLLAIVRERLDSAGVKYEYLDGATRDRQARVDAFRTIRNARCF